MNELLWFLFHMVGHMEQYSAHDWPLAISYAVHDINVALRVHNEAVLKAEAGHHWYVETSSPYMSDNQCALLMQLDKSTQYKLLEDPVGKKELRQQMEAWLHQS
jgi:hypothetical protein